MQPEQDPEFPDTGSVQHPRTRRDVERTHPGRRGSSPGGFAVQGSYSLASASLPRRYRQYWMALLSPSKSVLSTLASAPRSSARRKAISSTDQATMLGRSERL